MHEALAVAAVQKRERERELGFAAPRQPGDVADEARFRKRFVDDAAELPFTLANQASVRRAVRELARVRSVLAQPARLLSDRMQAILLSATVACAALDENLDPGWQMQDLLAVAERRQGGFSRAREAGLRPGLGKPTRRKESARPARVPPAVPPEMAFLESRMSCQWHADREALGLPPPMPLYPEAGERAGDEELLDGRLLPEPSCPEPDEPVDDGESLGGEFSDINSRDGCRGDGRRRALASFERSDVEVVPTVACITNCSEGPDVVGRDRCPRAVVGEARLVDAVLASEQLRETTVTGVESTNASFNGSARLGTTLELDPGIVSGDTSLHGPWVDSPKTNTQQRI